eukprot:4746-Heterococcus_DN1.PRE.1
MAPPVPQAWPAQGARARRHVDLLQVCAAEEGRYDLLKQLHMEFGCPWNVGAIAKAAAASGQVTLSVLQWLWEQPDGKWGEHDEVCKAVAQAGDVTVLQWMYDNQALFDEMLCTEAARGNKVTAHTTVTLEPLEWLVAHEFALDEWTCQGSLSELRAPLNASL